MQTPIHFYDPGDERHKSTRRDWISLGDSPDVPAACELTNGEDLPLEASDGKRPSANDQFVCLIHWSRLNFPTATVKKWANAHENARFIVISGGGQTTPADTPKNVLYYRQSVGQLLAGGFKTDFHTWYKAWSADTNYAWDPLNGDDEPLLAFRLLCEAKRAWGDADEKPRHSITIHAPKGIEDWLTPFSPKGIDNAEKITAVASMVGSDAIMGKAAAVLNAVKDNNNVDEAIKAFLDHR